MAEGIVHALPDQAEWLRAQQREAERQAEQLFQTLLHRAFRGEFWDHQQTGVGVERVWYLNR